MLVDGMRVWHATFSSSENVENVKGVGVTFLGHSRLKFYSDPNFYSQSKLRPAVVLADAGHGDRILCQLTSSSYSDAKAVKLENADFKRGSLMCQVKVNVDGPIDITSVMTLDTLADLGVKKGDSVRVLVKAVNVILVRE